MKLFYFITIFAILHTYIKLVSPQAAKTNSLKENTKKLLDNIHRVFTQVIPALPAELVINVLNKICTAFIDQIKRYIPEKQEPKLENIKLQIRTACDKREYPLSNIIGLVADKDFDRRKKTVIAATGWITTVENEQHNILAKAYNCRGDTNYLVLDVGNYENMLYTWSSVNTEVIGKYVAEGLQSLTSFVDIANLHLLGHSLGAHIMGSVGRNFRALTGKNLPYITGLDPALPCFSIRKELTTLSEQDADFVDIIHTNPGVFGQYKTYGHVGFYVGGKYPIKSGCETTICQHLIAVSYYAESVYPNNAENFIARHCMSSKRLICMGHETVMGYAVSRDVRGTYVLDVNSKPPFGKNANENFTDPKLSSCGSCKVAKQ